MTKYPLFTDKDFHKKINRIYKKYKIKKSRSENITKYCNPKKFELQLPQKFVADFLNPDTPYKSVLIYHKIGAGKTCTAIQVAEKWKHKRNIIFVVPASLKGNLRDELRSMCGKNEYLKQAERNKLAKLKPSDLEYKHVIGVSNKRIDKFYDIYSYNKFIEKAKSKKIKLNKSVLIIDEVQNLISERGSSYQILKDLIDSAPNDLRIVLLSATPMFDKPREIGLIMNLMKTNKFIPNGSDFEKTFITKKQQGDKVTYGVKNMDMFKDLIRGYVSYFSGAPSYTFPSMTIRYVECEMSDFQYELYKKLLKKEMIDDIKDPINIADLTNNFYIGTRFVSNIVFPNKKTGETGFKSLTTSRILKDLDRYSAKFNEMIERILSERGKIFIYSTFKEHAGIRSIAKILDAHGYTNYMNSGAGKKRYAVWSSDETNDMKDEIKEVFNRTDNLRGNKLQIILGSPSIKEGVSLKAVRYVHVVEPHWNQSRLSQVIGRASRFCSHKDLPEHMRKVKVYIYIAKKNDITTVDQYIKQVAKLKNKIIGQFEQAIKSVAIDCELNKNSNIDTVKCEK